MIAHDVLNTLVLTDGAELLIHDGPTDGPRWRRTLGAPIIAVGLTAREVVAVTDEGQAIWFEHDRDHELGRASAGDRARAAVVLSSGQVVVATAEGALILSPQGRVRTIPWADAILVAGAADGRILIADAAGKIGEFSATGVLQHQVVLDAPAVALAASARGFWIVAQASKLLRFDGGELHVITSAPASMVVRGVAGSPDGAAIAIVLGDALVLALSWPERDTIGQLRYMDRTVTGVAFGPAPWLVVALAGGDGNKLDLGTGDLARSDTFPGREHRRWMVQVSVDPPKGAPEPARAPAPADPVAAAPAQGGSGMMVGVLVAILALLGVLVTLFL